MSTCIPWTGGLQAEAIETLDHPGGVIVSPTKVGYVIIATDRAGLERKFEIKRRNPGKPAVVLCGSLEQLWELAELNGEAEELYRRHWEDDILLGCILPWRKAAVDLIPDDGSRELVRDPRATSCFVIRFGEPGELIARELWRRGRFAFASSANPSGQGNRGLVEGIGERIRDGVDLVVSADDYVASVQPDSDAASRYEQGVMVSLVDDAGRLVPAQGGRRGVVPAPTLIRKGLDVDRIMGHLTDVYPSWDYRHGQYY